MCDKIPHELVNMANIIHPGCISVDCLWLFVCSEILSLVMLFNVAKSRVGSNLNS